MAQSVPPSDEERELYYYGLPSGPRLIARSSSSSHPWVNPQMPDSITFKGSISNMYPRVLRPAKGDLALHQQWNDAASSLRAQIIQAVSAIDWTAIDILSVGLEKPEDLEDPEAGYHNTLLIAVNENSLSWRCGHTLALRCKAILEEHGIKAMHCEIRESDVVLAPSAQSPPPAASLSDDESDILPSELQLSSDPISFDENSKCRANLSDCLGTTISTMDRSYLRGTKGYYLSLNRKSDEGGSRSTVVALAVRHMAMDSKIEADGLKEYRYEPSQPRREVIQMDQVTYEAMLKDVDTNVEIYEEEVEQGRRRNNTDSVIINEILAKSSRTLSQTMKRYAAPSSRVFGHLLYASDFEPCTTENGAQWLRDWALIELDPSRHQKPLSSFTNTVFVGVPVTRAFEAVIEKCKALEGIPVSTPNIEYYTFRLKKELVPMSGLFKLPHADRKDENAIIVANYGATTGLTISLGNTLRSVTRRTDVALGANKTEREVISEEWCIVSAASVKDHRATFSQPGDSGSCIWDLDGRVAGLLTAGARSRECSSYDMTYAQPMERLLEDIRSKGFDVSLI